MSTAQYGLLLGSQFGSGSLQELYEGSVADTPDGTKFSLVTPTSVPSGRNLGNYVLRLTLSSSTSTYNGKQVQQANPANGYCFGYWWYPITNPSVNDMVLPFIDDGLANGMSLYWRSSDKAIAAFDFGHTSAEKVFTVTPDASSPKWYFIIISKPVTVGFMRVIIYEHNGGTAGTDADWTLKDDQQFAHTQGTGINMRISSASAATGSWDAGNFYFQDGIGSGPIMPLGKDMLTTFPINKTVNSTSIRRPGTSGTANAAVTTTNTTLTDTRVAWSTNQWSDGSVGAVVTCNGKTMTVTSNTGTVLTGASWSGGGNPGNGNAWSIAARDDTTTGTGDTEYQYIDEQPPVDTAADPGGYITHDAGSTVANAAQNYTITSGLVTGLNIIGISVGGRFYRPTTATGAAQVGREAPFAGSGFNFTGSGIDKWICDPYYASSYITGSTPFTPSDIDSLIVRHITARGGSGEVRISQLWVTIITGHDDTPPVVSPGVAVAGELPFLGVG